MIAFAGQKRGVPEQGDTAHVREVRIAGLWPAGGFNEELLAFERDSVRDIARILAALVENGEDIAQRSEVFSGLLGNVRRAQQRVGHTVLERPHAIVLRIVLHFRKL